MKLHHRFFQSNQVIHHLRFYALTALTIGGLAQSALADLTIAPTTDTASIRNSLIGKDVNITNLTINQGVTDNQVGIFSGGGTGGAGPLLGIEDGVVLVTGDVTSADGPNVSSGITTGGEDGPTDSSLELIDGGNQFDTVAIEFDVVPAGNTLSMEFVFASDEYNEYVCSTFNDAMGIFVSGPGITGEVNIARLSTNLTSFSINQINRGFAGVASDSSPAPCNLDNALFHTNNISNYDEPTTANQPTPNDVQNNFTNVEYDGFTVPLEGELQVQPGQTYTIKVVTADIGDSQWDGAVFLNDVDSYNLDYGDAPDSYGTSSINQAIQLPGPARHSETSTSVYLGNIAPDIENNGTPAIPPNAADGDDSIGVDDEDAFNDDLSISSGITNYTISDIPVNNNSSETAQLMGWIDFNQDGDFFDTGEQAIVNVLPNQTTANLSWAGFSATTDGITYARFRITTDPNLITLPSPVGLALDGEVEDYKVEIATSSLILVKRITNLIPNPNNIDFSAVIDDGTPENNDPNWENNFLQGQIKVDNVQPGDEVEYTIYFLSNGTGEVKNVNICDVVPDNMSFVENSFDIGKGIKLFFDSTMEDLSNTLNDDQGEFYSPNTDPPTFCQKIVSSSRTDTLVSVDSSNNNSGAVVVNLDNTLPFATGAGTPENSYGYIRFRVLIQ